MVVALLRLNQGLAIETTLPTCVLCSIHKLSSVSVGRAMLCLVPFVVAHTTYPSVAFSTCSARAAITVMSMILLLNPFPAFRSRAVVAVHAELVVPALFKAIVEYMADVLQRNDF